MTTIGYPYALPTTANVSFQEFLAPHAQYQCSLSDATAFRGRLRTALKEHRHSDRHDFLNVQKAVEDYIPLLFGLLAGIESSELRLTSEVETTWRCTLSNSSLSSKQPRVKQKSIHYEAIFTLLTLGYVLIDRANEYSQAVQKRILIAIGDISNSILSDGSSPSLSTSGGGGSHNNLTTNSNNINSNSIINTGSGSGNNTHHQTAGSRLFKKKAGTTASKSTKSNTIGEWTDSFKDEDLSAMDHQLTTAADLYCKAAGVFDYVVQEMIPRWNNVVFSSSGSVKDNNKKSGSENSRPVDIQTCVISAHSKLALGEAHACTVRKASIKAARASAAKLAAVTGGSSSFSSASAATSSSSSGSGSGSGTGSKTSYVLLAKLSIGVKEEYERAYGLLKSVKDLNDITSDFRAHVKDAKIYYEAVAQTFLGMDAYEAQHYGKAIGLMSMARASFAALAKSSKASTVAQAAAFEFRLANEKVFAFEKINDSVTFETVPTQSELLAIMPSGRDLLSSKKYLPPRPAFGAAHTATDAGQGGMNDGVNKLAYALQGAYF